ncbi:response regulator [Candidatus Parcubacteria bacterium]|nr:response regulator [Candidatus Parcubacteria bacterium]
MKTVLFVEDEAALQKTFGKILEEEGFKVISALDGDVGLKLAKLKKPDLILLDLILPKQNGFDVLKAIKEDEEIKDIPIIVLTNLETMDNVDRAIELGATTYLVKANYSLKEVITKVKQALSE